MDYYLIICDEYQFQEASVGIGAVIATNEIDRYLSVTGISEEDVVKINKEIFIFLCKLGYKWTKTGDSWKGVKRELHIV